MCSRHEIDHDLYAIRKLRQWRNAHHHGPRNKSIDRRLVRVTVARHQTDRTYRPLLLSDESVNRRKAGSPRHQTDRTYRPLLAARQS